MPLTSHNHKQYQQATLVSYLIAWGRSLQEFLIFRGKAVRSQTSECLHCGGKYKDCTCPFPTFELFMLQTLPDPLKVKRMTLEEKRLALCELKAMEVRIRQVQEQIQKNLTTEAYITLSDLDVRPIPTILTVLKKYAKKS